MPLSIIEITNPHEFAEIIKIDQKDRVYVYLEKFTKIGDYSKILDTFEKFSPSIMYSDIKVIANDIVSNQYFTDISSYNPQTIIFSPLITRYLPINLQVHTNLSFHCFSFFRQILKEAIPWHLPHIDFKIELNDNDFQQLNKDSQWVLQQGI